MRDYWAFELFVIVKYKVRRTFVIRADKPLPKDAIRPALIKSDRKSKVIALYKKIT